MQLQIIKIVRGMTQRKYCAAFLVPAIHRVLSNSSRTIYWVGFYYQKKFSKV